MDRRVTIQARAAALDAAGTGEDVGTWSNVVTVWAQVTPVGGRETAGAVQRYGEADVRFRIRWRTGLTIEHRLVFESRKYDILSIDEVGRHELLDIFAKARAEAVSQAPN